MTTSPDEKHKQVTDSAVKIFTLAGPEASFGLYGLFAPKEVQESPSVKDEEKPTLKK